MRIESTPAIKTLLTRGGAPWYFRIRTKHRIDLDWLGQLRAEVNKQHPNWPPDEQHAHAVYRALTHSTKPQRGRSWFRIALLLIGLLLFGLIIAKARPRPVPDPAGNSVPHAHVLAQFMGVQPVNIVLVGGVQPSMTGSSINVNCTGGCSGGGGGTVAQGTAAALSGYWPVGLTDGTNLLGTSTHALYVQFPSAQAVTGTFWQATQPVSGTFWQTTQPVSIATMPSTPVTGTFWQTTQPVSGTFWQSTQPVSIATMPSTPVTGTFWQTTQPVSGTFWQTTQPVSIASLPTDAVTCTAATCAINMAQVGGAAVTLGATTSSASLPVTNATDQGNPCENPNATVTGIAGATSGTSLTQIIALSSGKRIFLCSATLTTISGTSPTYEFEYGTGTNCGTGTTALVGPSATAAAGSIFTYQEAFIVPSSNALCYKNAGTTPIFDYAIVYVQQ